MEKEEVILQTKDARVRIMRLHPEEATPFHYHTEVTDDMFGISGRIVVRMKNPEENFILTPGAHCTVARGRVHQVANDLEGEASEYLLVQGVGRYDFVRYSFFQEK